MVVVCLSDLDLIDPRKTVFPIERRKAVVRQDHQDNPFPLGRKLPYVSILQSFLCSLFSVLPLKGILFFFTKAPGSVQHLHGNADFLGKPEERRRKADGIIRIVQIWQQKFLIALRSVGHNRKLHFLPLSVLLQSLRTSVRGSDKSPEKPCLPGTDRSALPASDNRFGTGSGAPSCRWLFPYPV